MEQAIDKGERLWRPVDPMRHHREKGWDYRGRAIYHFTLPVEGRYPLFGTLEGDSAETAAVRLNAYGRRVCQMLSGLAQFYKGKGYALKVLAQMVMPDHVHLVIQVLEPLPQSIGAVVRGFKSACTKVYKEEFYGSGENAAEVHGGARDNAEMHGGDESKARGDESKARGDESKARGDESKARGDESKARGARREGMRVRREGMRAAPPCILSASLRTGVVSGNKTQPTTTSASFMQRANCAG